MVQLALEKYIESSHWLLLYPGLVFKLDTKTDANQILGINKNVLERHSRLSYHKTPRSPSLRQCSDKLSVILDNWWFHSCNHVGCVFEEHSSVFILSDCHSICSRFTGSGQSGRGLCCKRKQDRYCFEIKDEAQLARLHPNSHLILFWVLCNLYLYTIKPDQAPLDNPQNCVSVTCCVPPSSEI